MESNPFEAPRSPIIPESHGHSAVFSQRLPVGTLLGMGFRTLLQRADALVPIGVAQVATNLLVEHLQGGAGSFGSTLVISTIIGTWLHGAIVVVVASEAAGERASLPHALMRSASCLPALLLAMVLYGLVTLLGLVALIIPGIYLALILGYAPELVVLRGHSPVEALNSSVPITRQRFPATFAIYSLVWVAGTVSAVPSLLPSLIDVELPSVFLITFDALSQVVTVAIQSAGVFLFLNAEAELNGSFVEGADV